MLRALYKPVKSVEGFCTSGQVMPDFFHFQPGYAVLALLLLSLNAPAYRPSYAVFGGHLMP
jgi:hypothetical protein